MPAVGAGTKRQAAIAARMTGAADHHAAIGIVRHRVIITVGMTIATMAIGTVRHHPAGRTHTAVARRRCFQVGRFRSRKIR